MFGDTSNDVDEVNGPRFLFVCIQSKNNIKTMMIMKKQLLLFAMILLPLVASAHDIEVKNADGKTIYYNYINDGKELEVTFRGSSYGSNSKDYQGNVVIPEEVTYMGRTRKVIRIGGSAFYDCKDLTSVNIPNSVTAIVSCAFEGCKNLTSVSISNRLESIGGKAFSGCISLSSFDIPNSVTIIESSAFEHCQSLNSIIIPDGITEIDYGTFSCCRGLTSITIPSSVTKIGVDAFELCTSLKSVSIPNTVTTIGGGAFYGCVGLTSITIPQNVTSIGYNAFDGWDLPVVISFIEDPFVITGKINDFRTFSQNTFNNATLYVPKGTIDKYKATDGWKDFVFIEEGTGGGDTPTTQKCEKPTISYENGKLTFTSETEGAVCQYSITDTDIKAGSGNEVQLGVTYNISVYATKSGYDNSETATATLCWIDQQPKTEGITNGIANVAAQAVLIQSEGGSIKVQGVDEGAQVNVYSVNGTQAGSAISQAGAATINTNLQPGSIAIVKIGQKSVKVVIK